LPLNLIIKAQKINPGLKALENIFKKIGTKKRESWFNFSKIEKNVPK